MSTNNGIVSIVDDDIDIVTLFRDALKNIAGVALLTFTDPVVALEHFHVNEHAYVMVISDLKMPGLDGMELIRKIKELNPFMRTILMTAFDVDDKIFREYAKNKIIDAFLQEPIRLDDFVKEVDTQLHHYETQKKFCS